jgi:hypothetical protein
MLKGSERRSAKPAKAGKRRILRLTRKFNEPHERKDLQKVSI